MLKLYEENSTCEFVPIISLLLSHHLPHSLLKLLTGSELKKACPLRTLFWLGSLLVLIPGWWSAEKCMINKATISL